MKLFFTFLGVASITAALFSPFAAAAQQTSTFTYQGSLNDGGQPANGSYDISLYVYNAVEGGEAPCVVFHTDVPVVAGIFTLDITCLDFSGEQRWLEMRVRKHGIGDSFTILAPRQAITTAPYAAYALNVANHAHAGESQGTLGEATATGVRTVGLKGITNSSNDRSAGVYGQAASDSGWTLGVHGVSYGNSGWGVWGESDSSAGPTRGVMGSSNSSLGTGVYGNASSASGDVKGVYGETNSVDGTGVYGLAFNSGNGNSRGVYGESNSPGGTGVQGLHAAASGRGAGVFGETASGEGASAASGTTFNDTQVAGVYGLASSTAESVRHGVVGVTHSPTGAGVYASNLGSASSGAPDLILGSSDFGDGGDNGIIASVPDDPNSDIFLHSMDTVVIRLNQDGSDDAQSTTSRLEVTYTDTSLVPNRIFYVDTDGDVFADRAYHCGQGIPDAAGELSESELAACLVDDSPADFAEMLAAVGAPEPGDVLVVGPDGKLGVSRVAYADNLVGVHSTRPSYLGNATHADSPGYVPLAVSGIVPVKASSENGPIRPGDLLTSAEAPGHAMRCEGMERCFGRVLGKALDALDAERGSIRVLVGLH